MKKDRVRKQNSQKKKRMKENSNQKINKMDINNRKSKSLLSIHSLPMQIIMIVNLWKNIAILRKLRIKYCP